MKIPKYIRRKRRLEVLGDGLLLRRLTQQDRALHHGRHDSICLFAERLISRYKAFLQLILSRREAQNKTRITLQFIFRLPFYIQNIDNRSSVQPTIYFLSKKIYMLKKSTISYIALRPSMNAFLLNKNERNNKYAIPKKHLISNSNIQINLILTNKVFLKTNILYGINSHKNEPLYHQLLQYHFPNAENLTNAHILIPSKSFETHEYRLSIEQRYNSKHLKILDLNTHVLNIKNYHEDTHQLFKQTSRYFQDNIIVNHNYNIMEKLDSIKNSLNTGHSRTDIRKIFKTASICPNDYLKDIYHDNFQTRILKSYIEKNKEKNIKSQINHFSTSSRYIELLNIINEYRFDDHKTTAYRHRPRPIQNTPYRGLSSLHNLTQIFLAQQILRPQKHESVPILTKITNLVRRNSQVVHADTLQPALSTRQPSEEVARKRQIPHYTEPEITHIRQSGMQQKSREDQGDVPNEPAVSLNWATKPLGIAEPPPTHRPFNIDDLANQVMQKMADKLKTEQERRGIFV
jgi:hypothetical protein